MCPLASRTGRAASGAAGPPAKVTSQASSARRGRMANPPRGGTGIQVFRLPALRPPHPAPGPLGVRCGTAVKGTKRGRRRGCESGGGRPAWRGMDEWQMRRASEGESRSSLFLPYVRRTQRPAGVKRTKRGSRRRCESGGGRPAWRAWKVSQMRCVAERKCRLSDGLAHVGTSGPQPTGAMRERRQTYGSTERASC